MVAERIQLLLGRGVKPSEIAVLYRNNSHSIELEAELVGRHIPYRKFGGMKFLEKAHVRDYLSYLKVASSPASKVSLRRVLEILPGVGRVGARKISDWVGGDRGRLVRISGGPFPRKAASHAYDLQALFAGICLKGDAMGDRPRLTHQYYESYLPQLYEDAKGERPQDIAEIRRVAEGFASLPEFLDTMALDPPEAQPGAKKDESRMITLSTVHSSKGLEWGHVFILSAVDDRMPSFFAMDNPEAMEEERRIFYVAVTRAKDSLWVMCPLSVVQNDGRVVDTVPTRFLGSLRSPL
jgi:DNA helicase-2/ATP-dependent DNA helicase PcrA